MNDLEELSAVNASVLPNESLGLRGPLPILTALRRHLVTAGVATVVLLAVGAVALHVRLQPRYSAESVIYVSPVVLRELTAEREPDRSFDNFMQQQISAVTQTTALRDAIAAFPGVWQRKGETEQQAVDRLATALKVAEAGRGYLFSISLTSANPSHLADFLNKITDLYLIRSHNDESFGRTGIIDSLRTALAQQENLLTSKRVEQAALLHSIGLAQLDSKAKTNPFDDKLTKLREQLADAHARRVTADARLTQTGVAANGDITLDEMGSDEINHDALLSSLAAQVGSRKEALQAKMYGLTELNPDRQKALRDLSEMEQSLSTNLLVARQRKAEEIRQRYQLDAVRASTLEGMLSKDLRNAMQSAALGTPNLQKASAVNDDIDRMQSEYNQIAGRIHTLSVEDSSPGSVHLDTLAVAPSGADPNKALLLYCVLAVAALLGGVVAAVIAYMLETRVYSGEDVSRLLGVTPIAGLLNAADFPAEVEQEFFLRLSGGIEAVRRRTGARTFVFTSVGMKTPHEIIGRLAAELSRSGLRTLILDPSSKEEDRSTSAKEGPLYLLDTQHEGALSGSHAPASKGTPSDLVSSGPSSLQESPRVEIKGFKSQNATEALRHNRPLYDLVLFMGDPILTSATTENAARAADGTVLMIQSGVSTKNQVMRASRVLERIRVAGIAVTLLDVGRKHADAELKLSLRDYKAGMSALVTH